MVTELKWLLFFELLAFFNLKASRTTARHSVGRSVKSFPEVAQRFAYYRKGLRTYKFYTGGYSRLRSI